MHRAELDYHLPPELIAQRPADRRDASRLLVLNRGTGVIRHERFQRIGRYLRPGDALVVNNTRVIPARFFCRRASGGRVEGLFLREERDPAAGGPDEPHARADAADSPAWRVLLKPSAKLKVGEQLALERDARQALRVVARHERGEWSVQPAPAVSAVALLERCGETPLPPYIRTTGAGRAGSPDDADRERYQTVYARQPGAVAAPTAGLHFTPELLERLARHEVRRIEVTLHVGLGTFAPIEAEDLTDHAMHAEWYSISAASLNALREVRASGGRIVAVGTTSVRVLESLPDGILAPAATQETGDAPPASRGIAGWTSIFIYPPYRFRHVNAVITNFHLPGSTLLALVMAFAGADQVRTAYAEAIRARYRFYSYGDAMLIL